MSSEKPKSNCLICSSVEPLPEDLNSTTEAIKFTQSFETSILNNGLSLDALFSKDISKNVIKNVEMFEILCEYLKLNIQVSDDLEETTLFCQKCVELVSEIVALHKAQEEIKRRINFKVNQIEESLADLKCSDNDLWIFQEFYKQVIKKRSKRKANEFDEERITTRNKSPKGQGPPYQHIVEIEPSLMHQNLEIENIQIKVQPEDFDDMDDDFSTGEIEPDFLAADSDNNFEENPEDSDYQMPPTPIQRRLRPRATTATKNNKFNNLQKNNSQQKDNFNPAVVQIKCEPESEDEEDDYLQENFDDPEDDPDVNLSEESVEEESDSDSDDEWNAPKKKSKGGKNEISPRSSRRSTRNNNAKPLSESPKKSKTADKNGEDVVMNDDGKIMYKNIEITKTDTSEGYIFKCGECNREITLKFSQLRSKRESIFYRIKVHIRAAHFGAYSCPMCPKTLSNCKSLKRHVLCHTSTEPKAHCAICNKPFKTAKKDFLKVHEWSHKSEEEKLAAIAEGQKAPLTYAEKVQATKERNPGNFQCTQCDKNFLWKSLLKKHIGRVHVPENEKVKNFSCHVCQKLFASQGDLTSHKRHVCEKDKLPRLYFCAHCEKKFTNKDDCSKHERKHTKEKPFMCTKCSKCYSQERSLKNHMQECDGKKGGSGGTLYEGFEIFHEDEETGFTLRCGSCDFLVEHDKLKHQARSDSYRKMHIHIRGKHLGAYKCNICQKQLSEPKGLRNHLATHDKEAKHHCSICGKPFKTKASNNKHFYKSHYWSHLSEQEKQEKIAAGETPPLTYAEKFEMVKKSKEDNFLQCDQCGKRFAWQCQLKKHERVHAGKEHRTHQCAACGKFYATADSLNSHVKHIHDKDKVHKWHYCTFCEKKFSHKFAWRKHERSHRRETLKPFQCSLCSKAFSQEKNFQNHIKQCGQTNEQQQQQLQIQQSQQPDNKNRRPISASSEEHSIMSSESNNIVPMSIPAHSHSSIILNNPHLHHQFRQMSVPPGGGPLPTTSSVLHPGGHHFMANGPNNNRFYEDGNIFQNFF